MHISLDTVRMIANRLPFDSCSNMMIRWFDTKGWLDTTDLTFSTFTQFDDKSIDTAILAVARLGFAYFLFPRVTTPVAVYNLAVGAYYISMGFVSAFNGTRTKADQKKVFQDFHTGFVHALTAAYDYAVGYLIKTPILGFAGSALFATLPSVVLNAHEKVFKTPEPEKREGETTQAESASKISQPRLYVSEECKIHEVALSCALSFVPPIPSDRNSSTG